MDAARPRAPRIMASAVLTKNLDWENSGISVRRRRCEGEAAGRSARRSEKGDRSRQVAARSLVLQPRMTSYEQSGKPSANWFARIEFGRVRAWHLAPRL